jgi:hypothetical protein
VLEQSDSLLFHQLIDHVAEDRTDSIKALIGLADVSETNVVQKDLLHNENGHGLAELRSCLHNAQAKRDDLSSQQEVDDFGGIVLDKGTDDTQRSETEILEWPGLGRGIEKRVEKEGNMRCCIVSKLMVSLWRFTLPLRKRPRVSV